MLHASGIYKITSPSGKCYIGSAVNFRSRWHGHLSVLRRGKHHSPILQLAYNKYGEDAIKFEILFVCAKEDLLLYEQRALDIMKPEYNIALYAGAPMRGRKLSTEQRARLSEVRRNSRYVATESHRKAISDAHKGKAKSEETKAKFSAAWTEERKAAWSKSQTGRKMSAEAVEKMAATKRGKKLTPEHLAKMSVALTGKKKSAESIEKTASAHRGRKNSPEVREKMSRLARERAAKKRQDKLSLSLFDDRTQTVSE